MIKKTIQKIIGGLKKATVKNKFMESLINKKCVPHKKMVALTQEEIKDYLSQLKNWKYQRDPASLIRREFKFEDFVKAMEFVNKVADVAEKEGHHPDIAIHYNKVDITLWSHFINGLSINDFIIAAKIDSIT